MDPKQQAEAFYKSLAAADAFSCKLLARGAQIQRGRVVALERRLQELKDKNGPKDKIALLAAEIDKRKEFATKLDTLDSVIDKAIKERATLDKNKFK